MNVVFDRYDVAAHLGKRLAKADDGRRLEVFEHCIVAMEIAALLLTIAVRCNRHGRTLLDAEKAHPVGERRRPPDGRNDLEPHALPIRSLPSIHPDRFNDLPDRHFIVSGKIRRQDECVLPELLKSRVRVAPQNVEAVIIDEEVHAFAPVVIRVVHSRARTGDQVDQTFRQRLPLDYRKLELAFTGESIANEKLIHPHSPARPPPRHRRLHQFGIFHYFVAPCPPQT